MSGITHVRMRRTSTGHRMARPVQHKHQLAERHEQQGKPNRESQRLRPASLELIQKFVHTVASSRSENSSTRPMPRTSELVAAPKVTRSRTRS